MAQLREPRGGTPVGDVAGEVGSTDYGPGRLCCMCSARVSRYRPPVPDVGVSLCALCAKYKLVAPGWHPEPAHDGGWLEEPGDEAAEERAQWLIAHAGSLLKTTRRCRVCQEEKDSSEFARRGDGRAARCGECEAVSRRLRLYGRAEPFTPEEVAERRAAAIEKRRQTCIERGIYGDKTTEVG